MADPRLSAPCSRTPPSGLQDREAFVRRACHMHADDRAARASPRAPATIVGAAFLLGARADAGRVRRRSHVRDAARRRFWRNGAAPATRASRRRTRPTACGGRRSMIRRSIAWSTSPTGRTCRCRSPACGSSRRARSSASPPAGSFPRRRQLFASGEAVGLTEQVARYTGLDRNLLDYQVGFDAAWELDFWGKYRRGVEAEAPTCSRRWPTTRRRSCRSPRRSRGPTSRIRTAEVLIKQAQDNARIQEEALGIAKARFQAGATSELDPTQATTLLESTRASVPRFEIELAAGAQRPEHAARSAGGHGRGAAGGTQGDSEAAREGGGRRARRDAAAPSGHPRRRAVRRRAVRPHRRRQGGALSELLADRHDRPARAQHAARRPTTCSPPAASSTPSVPSINFPFFNYGRLTNGVRVEDARFQQLLVSYRDTVLKAAQEVEDALAGFLNSPAGDGVRAERRDRRAAFGGAGAGAIPGGRRPTTSACWTRNVRCCSSRTAWPRPARPSSTNLIALYKALGGGWELQQGQPVVPAETQREMEARTDWGDMLSSPRPPETANNPPPGKQ